MVTIPPVRPDGDGCRTADVHAVIDSLGVAYVKAGVFEHIDSCPGSERAISYSVPQQERVFVAYRRPGPAAIDQEGSRWDGNLL